MAPRGFRDRIAEVLRSQVERTPTHVKSRQESYNSGQELYDQGKFKQAEKKFRQAVREDEKTVGKDHKNTLSNRYWIAQAVYSQKRYQEAEELFQQVVYGREKVSGEDNYETLNSKFWLAKAVYSQERYQEAKKLFQQVVQGQVKVLGEDYTDTLISKYWLAKAIYSQKRYQEAEDLFQQVFQREKILGNDHAATLSSKFWLARAVYSQDRYQEAEDLFQQIVQRQEKQLGEDNSKTLNSKHWLAQAVYSQKRYQEAGELFRQVVQGRVKVLGEDDANTLESISYLTHAISFRRREEQRQEDQRRVEQWQEGQRRVDQRRVEKWREEQRQEKKLKDDQQQEKLLEKGHTEIDASENLLQKMQFKIHLTSNGIQETLRSRLGHFFPEGKARQSRYQDSEIYEISSLLKSTNLSWSKVPRTYIVLRIIGCLSLLDNFIDAGFSDHWFPVAERTLPHFLRPIDRSQFVEAQDLILTKSMNLEKGKGGQHCCFRQGDRLPFERKGVLGNGGFGDVDKVISLITFREYARKRVPRRFIFGGRKKGDITKFVDEIEILKRLDFRHVVEFVGSYTDHKYMGLIMYPVAEMDLSAYLTRIDITKHGELRTFFGCLANGLEYLHEQNVRHKDIKPGNILVDRGKVMFTDFGLSLDFTDASGSTTFSTVTGMTAKYCAPEVALHEPRNTSSDIWSLGIVFLEMVVVLKGKTVEYMD